jgi:hypothetical protein
LYCIFRLHIKLICNDKKEENRQ